MCYHIGISPFGGLVYSFSQLYFTINLEEIFYFNNKKMPYLCGFWCFANAYINITTKKETKLIGETENIDKDTLFILEAAALTHDIGIHLCEEKYGNCNGKLQEKEGPDIAKKMLSNLGFEDAVSDRVQYLIAHHHTYTGIDGIDYQILVEADFLVNMHEDSLSADAIEAAYNNIFKTETGKRICKEMFFYQN